MRWGSTLDAKSEVLVSWCGNHVASGGRRPRLGKKAASATPTAFRNELLRIAGRVVVERMGHRERSATPCEFRDALIGIARDAARVVS